MTISGFLPQRWRATPEAARHAEAIAGVLHTPPIEPSRGGAGIVSLLGSAQVLPYLLAAKSLHRWLGRGALTVVDDGTLTGEDRAILAHHCADPEIVPHQTVRRGPFPPDAEWAPMLTALDRRAGQFWIALDPHTVTLADLPEAAAAIASNRSFGLVGRAASGGPARQVERRLAALCGTRGWRYRSGCGGLSGFAAGGTGRALAGAFQAETAALGEAVSVDAVRNLVLANEAEPVWLSPSAAFAYFPRGRCDGEAYAEASRAAIAQLLA